MDVLYLGERGETLAEKHCASAKDICIHACLMIQHFHFVQDPEGRLVESVQGSMEVFLDDEMRRVERFKDMDTPDIFERTYVSALYVLLYYYI